MRIRPRRQPHPMWAKPCKPPISDDCSTLSLTATWAVQCLVPVVERFRERQLSADAITNEVLSAIPQCHIEPETDAEHELRRRVQAAVQALIDGDQSWLTQLLG